MSAADQKLLDQAVERVVEAVQPLRVILFGSAAREEMGPHSDFDVLVVMPDGCHCRTVAKRLYHACRGLGSPTDFIVVQESDVRIHGDDPYLIIHNALAEGRELYHAAG